MSIGGLLNGKVIVRWLYPTDEQKKLKGFAVLLRRHGEDWRTIADSLPPTDRQFTTGGRFLNGQEYAFAIVAQMRSGETAKSEGLDFLYKKPAAVPLVRNVKARRVAKDGRLFLYVTWDPPAEPVPVRRYVIASDRGLSRKFQVEMGLGDVVKTEVRLTIGNRTPRDYTVGVAVMREADNATGEFATFTLKNVRGFLPPPPTKLTIKKLPKRGIYGLLQWEIPEAFAPHVKGFRIYSSANIYLGKGKERDRTHEKLLFDESKVTAEMRSFRIGPHLPRSEYWYYLEVVSKGGFESYRHEKRAYCNPLRCREYDDRKYKIKQPAPNFRTEYIEDPAGPDYVHVSWGKQPEDDAELVEGYEVDFAPRDACVGRLPLKTTRFDMRIPLKDSFAGKLDVSMELMHCFGRRAHKQTATLVIPSRIPRGTKVENGPPVAPIAKSEDFLPRSLVLALCGIASVAIFVVLLRGTIRSRSKS